MDCLMISGWVDVLRSAKVEWASGGGSAGRVDGNSNGGLEEGGWKAEGLMP